MIIEFREDVANERILPNILSFNCLILKFPHPHPHHNDMIYLSQSFAEPRPLNTFFCILWRA